MCEDKSDSGFVNDSRYYYWHREELGRLYCEATVKSEYYPDRNARKIFMCGKAAELYPKSNPEVALCPEHKHLID